MKAVRDAVIDSLLEIGLLASRADIQEVIYFRASRADISLRRRRGTLALPNVPVSIGPIREVEVSGPYLNVVLNDEYLEEAVLQSIAREGPSFGFDSSLTGSRWVIEHTSINPVYPINVATFRSSVIGNALAHSCVRRGAVVKTHFWVEDSSRHVKLVVDGLRAMNETVDSLAAMHGKTDHVIGAVFAAALYKSRGRDQTFIDARLRQMFPRAHFVPSFGEERAATRDANAGASVEVECRAISDLCVRGFEGTFEAADISVDSYDVESEECTGQVLHDVLQRFNDRKDQGVDVGGLHETDLDPSSYLARNVAYYRARLEGGDRVVSVVSHRQRDLMGRVLLLLRILWPEMAGNLQIMFFGDVTIGEAGLDSVSNGVFHPVDDLVSEHAVALGVTHKLIFASLQFALLRSKAAKTCHLSGTVTTLHRPFIRICLTLLKIRRIPISPRVSAAEPIRRDGAYRALLKHIALLPDVLEDAAASISYHRLAHYCIEMSNAADAYMRVTDGMLLDERLLSAADVALTNSIGAMGITISSGDLAGVERLKRRRTMGADHG